MTMLLAASIGWTQIAGSSASPPDGTGSVYAVGVTSVRGPRAGFESAPEQAATTQIAVAARYNVTREGVMDAHV
jgi:hypothetical protein